MGGILKRGYSIKPSHFQKQTKSFSKTNNNILKTIPKKNSNKYNHFQKQIKPFLKRTQTNTIIPKKNSNKNSNK